MLLSTVYIHKREKLLEGEGMRWKQMEVYGSLWKTREQSIDKYVSDGQSGPGSWMEAERERRNRKGKLVSGAVRDMMSIPVDVIPRVLRGVVMRHGMVLQVAGQRRWVLG